MSAVETKLHQLLKQSYALKISQRTMWHSILKLPLEVLKRSDNVQQSTWLHSTTARSTMKMKRSPKLRDTALLSRRSLS